MGTTPITSGLDPNTMQVLATSSSQKLLYDFSNTGDFFILTTATKVLQQTSPKAAFDFLNAAGTTVIYNPFSFNSYLPKPSTQV